jgi:hypothetical protein
MTAARWKCSLCGEICANLAVHVGRNHADQVVFRIPYSLNPDPGILLNPARVKIKLFMTKVEEKKFRIGKFVCSETVLWNRNRNRNFLPCGTRTVIFQKVGTVIFISLNPDEGHLESSKHEIS